MIRDTYKIVKAKVGASCKYYYSFYELKVWYEDTDLESGGIPENVGMSTLKEIAGVKKGDGFKKIQTFLDTEEGMKWLGQQLQERDLTNEKDKVKEYIRIIVHKMDLEELKEYEKLGRDLIKIN
jgi:hypothetical protein